MLVPVRQIQIEEDQVGGFRRQGPEHLPAGGGPGHRQLLVFEMKGQERQDHGVVFDDKHALGSMRWGIVLITNSSFCRIL